MATIGVEVGKKPNSALADEKLAPFLDPAFDPADYLNASLPTWSPPSTTTSRQHDTTTTALSSLSDISTETQTLLSRLNAQITRLSATLTQLTDDILRSGGRLSYEVELLRGDVASLSETLTEGLRDDIQTFVPNGLDGPSHRRRPSRTPDGQINPLSPSVSQQQPSEQSNGAAAASQGTPEYVQRLQMLMAVRARLDGVVKLFGEAMEWVVPPSELSIKSSLLAVTAPESNKENDEREVKGKEYAERVRGELNELINEGSEDSLKAAAVKVERMRELAQVWKGTAEEKARQKFADSLAKTLEDKQRGAA